MPLQELAEAKAAAARLTEDTVALRSDNHSLSSELAQQRESFDREVARLQQVCVVVWCVCVLCRAAKTGEMGGSKRFSFAARVQAGSCRMEGESRSATKFGWGQPLLCQRRCSVQSCILAVEDRQETNVLKCV